MLYNGYGCKTKQSTIYRWGELQIGSFKDDYQEVSMSECLVCDGKGFFRKLWMKCKFGTYSLVIGVCIPCASFGVLGATCSYCNKK